MQIRPYRQTVDPSECTVSIMRLSPQEAAYSIARRPSDSPSVRSVPGIRFTGNLKPVSNFSSNLLETNAYSFNG